MQILVESISFHRKFYKLPESNKGITKFCIKLSMKVNLPVERNAKGKGGYYLWLLNW